MGQRGVIKNYSKKLRDVQKREGRTDAGFYTAMGAKQEGAGSLCSIKRC